MNILITGHHLDLTPAIRQYVESKLERVTRHLEKIVEIDVTLAVDTTAEKDKRQRAEANLRLKGDTLHAESHSENLYAAIDGMIEKLDRQVLKTKGKITDHRQESAKRTEEASSAGSED